MTITDNLRTTIQEELKSSVSSLKRSYIMEEREEGSPLEKRRLWGSELLGKGNYEG